MGRKKQDEVEVVPLGKQPSLEKVHGATDKDGRPMHLFKAKLEEQFEYRASGKAVRELVGMASKTVEKRCETEAQLEKQFGYDRITSPSGEIQRRRLDEIAELRDGNPMWGKAPTRPTMTVPALPWQKDRKPGERYEDYRRRKRLAKETI